MQDIIFNRNNMKTKVFLALIITSLVSCNEVDKLLTFNVTNQASFTVNSGFVMNFPLEIPTQMFRQTHHQILVITIPEPI